MKHFEICSFGIILFLLINFSASSAISAGASIDTNDLNTPTLTGLNNSGAKMPDGSAYPQSAYTLSETQTAPASGLNIITKYVINETAKTITPKYYEIFFSPTDLNKNDADYTVVYTNTLNTPNVINPADGTYPNRHITPGGAGFQNPAGSEKIFNNVLFKENLTTGVLEVTDGNRYYDEEVIGGALYNAGKITLTDADFVKNSVTVSAVTSSSGTVYASGGAIGNVGEIDSISGNFIENSASSSYSGAYANGGAIYNKGTIGNVNGSFSGNYASATRANGGAIYNEGGIIGAINGDFMSNHIESTGSSYGGAVYNYEAEIGDITGSFVTNRNETTGGSIGGGAIYNYESKMGNLTGDFLGNYSSGTSSVSGGAIFNDENSTIKSITGDFIGNYADGYAGTRGGAIANNWSTIGDITGDFISNYILGTSYSEGGAIYNYRSEINNITGDFVENYAKSTNTYARGGAIYNEKGNIGDIEGDFVRNSSITEAQSYANGGAIYNVDKSKIGDITGNFIENKTVSDNISFGGAIYNEESEIGNIKGHFIGNTANSTSATAMGGAIYNVEGSIKNITGSFIKNSVTNVNPPAYGGAIYTDEGVFGNIEGDFIENFAISENAPAQGGAIDAKDSEFGDIKGSFLGNYVSANSLANGGAIYADDSKFGNIKGNFTGNYVKSENAPAQGGAIYADDSEFGNIEGNFTGNYSESENVYAHGGAIYADGSKFGNIKGNFIGNYAKSETAPTYGGAIANMASNIGNITGDFIENSVETAAEAIGGAVYSTGTIKDIKGNFVNNHAYSTNSYATGGAISNNEYYGGATTIGNIEGNFIGNYVKSDVNYTQGGAIFNEGTIGNIKGDFADNSATGTNSRTYGGAISNTVKIGDIEGSFYNNSVTALRANGGGGAIYNNGEIGNIKGDFIGNNVSVKSEINSFNSFGGAISNDTLGTIKNITGNFINNSIITENSEFAMTYGGAICNWNEIGTISGDFVNNSITAKAGNASARAYGGAIYTASAIEILNSSFINNTAKAESEIEFDFVFVKGGAIYSAKDLKITADKGNSIFSGNKSISTINKGSANEQTTVIPNAIYLDSSSAVLTLNAVNNGQIYFDDQIDGAEGYKIELTGDSSGRIALNDTVNKSNVTSENITLSIAEKTFKDADVTFKSGALNLMNNSAQQYQFNTFNLNGNISIGVDVDLANEKMDNIKANNYSVNDGIINVNSINLLSDSSKDSVSMLFAEAQLAGGVTTSVSSAQTPTFLYNVGYNSSNGNFTFSKQGYNPAVLPTPVTQQTGGYTTQLNTFNYSFQHANIFMNIPYLERVAMKNANRYAVSPTGDATDVGNFSPLFTKNESEGFWIKPYSSFENVPLKNGPKVSNINYGTLIGHDSVLTPIKHGFDRVVTGYIGYNGASQRFNGVDSYQNGGILGSTVTLYKGNFFTATTASVGASAGSNTTMYGNENYTMLLAGVANKSGYNFEFAKGKITLQPSFLISYTFVNTFDYRNAAGLMMKSDPLNAIQLAPGIKLIGNTKNGWQPYLAVNMIWNLLDKSRVTADDVRLPEMSIDPYVEYGAGVQKRFNDDKLTAYFQTMLRSGGRNGVSLTAGFRWSVGKK